MDERKETSKQPGPMFFLALILTAAGACYTLFQTTSSSRPKSHLVKEEERQIIEGVGQIASTRQQTVTATSEGIIVEIKAPGERATAGQTLAVLESESLERMLGTARRELRLLYNQAKISRNDLESRRIDLTGRMTELIHRAESQRQRVELIRPLMESGAISRFEFESERLKRGELEAQLSALEEQMSLIENRIALNHEDFAEQLAAAEATVRQTEQDLDALSVSAPFSGRWTDVAFGIGERVSAGSALGNLIDDGATVFLAQMPERHLSALSENIPVEVYVAGRTVAGRITRINRVVSGGLFITEIQLDAATDWVAGQSGSYRFSLPLTEPRYWVSAELGVEAHTQAEVWVERDGARDRRTVQFGARLGDRLTVQAGAVAGDRLSLAD